MFHFLHTVGVQHFDLAYHIVVYDAVHIGKDHAVALGEGGQLAEMALVIVGRNHKIIGAGRAELPAGGDLEAGVTPLAHDRQINIDGRDRNFTNILVAVDLHHRQFRVQRAGLGFRLGFGDFLLQVGHDGLRLGTGVGILITVVAVEAARRQQEHHTQRQTDQAGRDFTHFRHASCCDAAASRPQLPAPDRCP